MPKYANHKLETLLSVQQFVQGGPAPAFPMMLFLETSNLCNFKCLMCGPFSKLNPRRLTAIANEDRGFMPKETAFRTEELLAHAFRTPVFGYGEPTINPDFPDFLRLCGQYETMASFFTNGMRLTPELCETIVDNRVFEVTVSFSGSTKAEYEAIYEGGVWETVLGGIQELARQKREKQSAFPMISINSIGYRHHVDRLEEFVEIMSDAGANRLMLIPLGTGSGVYQLAHHVSIPRPWVEGEIIQRAKAIAASRGVDVGFDLYEATSVSDESEYSASMDALFEGLNTSQEVPAVPVEDLKRLTVDIDPPPAARPPEAHPEPGSRAFEGFIPAGELGAEGVYCFEPFHTLYVSRNGQLKPCCNATLPIHMGSIFQQSAVDAWRGEAFGTVRQTILGGGYPTMCRSCVVYEPHPFHNFLSTANTYRQWFEGVFGEALPHEWNDAMAAIVSTGSNADIVQRQKG